MVPIRDATVGQRYLSPERTPITNRGPSPHTPEYYEVSTDGGRIVAVPGDYQVQPEEDVLQPEPAAAPVDDDPWGGESTGLGRVAIVKGFTRAQCEVALAKIEAGTLMAQATVRRELGRQLEALAKIEASDPRTVEGRDELLRLRALESTERRPGLLHTIDELLGNVPITGAAEAAATAASQRIVDEGEGDALAPRFVSAVSSLAAELGRPLQQIDLYTLHAMTSSVRSARAAAKACTDPTLLTIAWRAVSADTIREVLARRHRALTGVDPVARAPTEAPQSESTAERIDVRDLRLVPLPDGSSDVWAVPATGRARRLGKATDPRLSAVVELMRRETAGSPPPALTELGALGPWLEAVKAAGFKVSITITTEDP